MAKKKPDRGALKESGRITSLALAEAAAQAAHGTTTMELDKAAEALIRREGGTPAFLGHNGFPGTLCTSVNDQVVHGLPGDYVLDEGDVVSLDVGVKVKGWYTDSAVTVVVGKSSGEATRLVAVTAEALTVAKGQMTAGRTTGDLGAAVQKFVEGEGFAVVRDCVGHGIGRQLHEEPSLPNFGKPGTGETFVEGMVLAVEPMVVERSPELELSEDKWTLRTRDRGLAAHFEQTVIVTGGAPEVLTPLPKSLRLGNADDRVGKVA